MEPAAGCPAHPTRRFRGQRRCGRWPRGARAIRDGWGSGMCTRAPGRAGLGQSRGRPRRAPASRGGGGHRSLLVRCVARRCGIHGHGRLWGMGAWGLAVPLPRAPDADTAGHARGRSLLAPGTSQARVRALQWREKCLPAAGPLVVPLTEGLAAGRQRRHRSSCAGALTEQMQANAALQPCGPCGRGMWVGMPNTLQQRRDRTSDEPEPAREGAGTQRNRRHACPSRSSCGGAGRVFGVRAVPKPDRQFIER